MESTNAHVLCSTVLSICAVSPLLRALVHLIHNDVSDAFEVGLSLESPQ